MPLPRIEEEEAPTSNTRSHINYAPRRKKREVGGRRWRLWALAITSFIERRFVHID
jgi:hypothetical protein